MSRRILKGLGIAWVVCTASILIGMLWLAFKYNDSGELPRPPQETVRAQETVRDEEPYFPEGWETVQHRNVMACLQVQWDVTLFMVFAVPTVDESSIRETLDRIEVTLKELCSKDGLELREGQLIDRAFLKEPNLTVVVYREIVLPEGYAPNMDVWYEAREQLRKQDVILLEMGLIETHPK